MACITKIAANLLFDCETPPAQGLETTVILINRADINRTLSEEATDGTQDIELVAGTTGYKLEGVKQLNSYNATLEVADDKLTKVVHSFVGRIFNITPETRTFIQALINGGNVVAVVEKLAKGALNANAYQILGWQNGLEISEGVENSAENDGAFTFVLSSPSLAREPRMPLIYKDTDYATSKAKFDNAFTAIVIP